MKPSFLPTLFLLFAGAAACASSASPPANPVTSTPGTSCQDIEQQGVRRIGAVLAAHKACTADADCESVSQGGTCFDHCTARMAREGDAALQAVTADVAAHECRDFAARGCHAVSPPCMALPAAACHHGVCE
ncbi:MAG TPA: hypothetical protein VIJ22_11105 [Polyangiaceae bacterium]